MSYIDPRPGRRNLELYRANVGLLLFNRGGQVFFGKRSGERRGQCWQFPQGGIDAGEHPEAAAWRELFEETGVDQNSARLIDQSRDWLVYDFPEDVLRAKRAKGRNNLGQKQLWYAFRFTGSDADIKLDCHGEVEFDEFRWEALERTPELVIPWKRGVYQEVARRFAHLAVSETA